jgi:hypothetical protein
MKHILFIFGFMFSFNATAQMGGSYFALQMGMGNVTANDTFEVDTELTYGVSIGAQLSEHLSLGAYINFYSTNEALDATSSLKVKVVPILAELTWSLDAPAYHHTPYISGLLGVARTNVEATTLAGIESSNETDTAAGVRAGYSFMISPMVAMGPDLSFIHVFYEDDDTANGDDEFNVWNAQVFIRGWF